ncbi:porin family protein [Pseudoalteromonas sp. JBTF-M23]|uniref:Porin family protein n=1 Tax=Pseudoalteromonas caenipelagi TaxID=2726988 RepID=A0A849VFU2_9GAMM|nr:outer membrane beta-barrel protein [Pseudoalteromonas caenipelagi]NOU50581.1 porin family protein [Pseudoalteromonas caenipelagi]
MKPRSLIVFAILFATNSFASYAAQNGEIHRVGTQINSSAASYKNSQQDGDGVMSLYLYYNYNIDDTWALELGVNGGAEITDWDCKKINNRKFKCDRNNELLFGIGADEVSFGNFVVAAKGQYQLTDNSHFYGKLGGQYYDYKIANNNIKMVQEYGLGLFAEAGWQYDWSNGLAFNAGLQYMDMGDLDTRSLSIGMSYRF